MDLNMHPMGAGLPRIIGPAGGDISGFSGPDFSSQLRVLPTGTPPERDMSYQKDMIHMLTNVQLGKVRCATPRRHPISPKPLKLGDELGLPGSPRSPSGQTYILDAIEQPPQYLLEHKSAGDIQKLPSANTHEELQKVEMEVEGFGSPDDNFSSELENSLSSM